MKVIIYSKQKLKLYYFENKLYCYNYSVRHNEVIFENAVDDFDAVCHDGKVFVLCQNYKNYFYLITYDGEKWEQHCILESSAEKFYYKNIFLINVNGYINAFYTLNRENSKIIIHHIINGNDKPEIIFEDSQLNSFSVSKDNLNNLYCFAKQKNKFGYKCFKWGEKYWSDFYSVCQIDDEIRQINTVFDSDNNSHIVLSTGNSQNNVISYIYGNKMTELFSNSVYKLSPVIVLNDTVNVLFNYYGKLLYCNSLYGKSDFGKASYLYEKNLSVKERAKLVVDKSVFKSAKGLQDGFVYGDNSGQFFNICLLQESLDSLEAIKLGESDFYEEIKPEVEEFMEESNNDFYYQMLNEKIDNLSREIEKIKERL